MKIDWHVHTVLSPCANLDMSPTVIFETARQKGIQVIGICDHNSTRQARLMGEMEAEVRVLPGVELTSKEEIHCLAFFDDLKALDGMQELIDWHLPKVKNKPEIFGDQVVVDEKGKILYVEENLLHMAIDLNLDELIHRVREFNGLVIPAHANKPVNSILSQLGWLPPMLDVDALEIIGAGDVLLDCFPWVYSSDAHCPNEIGQRFTELDATDISIVELKRAFTETKVRRYIHA